MPHWPIKDASRGGEDNCRLEATDFDEAKNSCTAAMIALGLKQWLTANSDTKSFGAVRLSQ
jgi:hypothetical protein